MNRLIGCFDAHKTKSIFSFYPEFPLRNSRNRRNGSLSNCNRTWTFRTMSDNAEDTLARLERAWMDAWIGGDRETCARILADDFLLTSARGILMTKGQWLNAMASIVGESFRWEEIRVRLFGGCSRRTQPHRSACSDCRPGLERTLSPHRCVGSQRRDLAGGVEARHGAAARDMIRPRPNQMQRTASKTASYVSVFAIDSLAARQSYQGSRSLILCLVRRTLNRYAWS